MGRDEPTNLQLHSWQSAGDCYRRHSQLHHVRDFRSALFRIAGSRSRAFGIDPLYRRCSCNRTCCDCGLVPMGADPAVLHLVDCLRHYSGFGR
ncbi:Uncharacterised protein [Vibrio cholerae]|nr:Uncharacterised protein [Vibrio cholerae]CSI52418.1 Uncharacterised protein [Vibrio cholerae]